MRRTQRRPKFAKIITIMSEVIKLKRGLDIQLVGAAEKRISVLPLAASYAVCPEDYRGVTPKLLVNVDDRVKAGGPLFFDKSDPRVMITSPVSGRVSAIRRACAEGNTFDLSGCEMYSSCEPCPMCLSALYWAGIDRLYYANTRRDAADIGFDDSFIYDQIALPPEQRSIGMEKIPDPEAQKVFERWIDKKDKVEY